jgi:hypothetical protein
MRPRQIRIHMVNDMTPENEKARKLLFSFLTLEQRETFLDSKGFTVIGESTQRKYRLGYNGGLSVFDHQFSYCINLTHDQHCCFPPYEDHLLAQKIILETDELYFLRKAHRSPIYLSYHELRFTMPMPLPTMGVDDR